MPIEGVFCVEDVAIEGNDLFKGDAPFEDVPFEDVPVVGDVPMEGDVPVEGHVPFEGDVPFQEHVPLEGNDHVEDVVEDVSDEENKNLGLLLEPTKRKVRSSEQNLYTHTGML